MNHASSIARVSKYNSNAAFSRGQESGHLLRSQVHRDVGRSAAQRRRAAGRRAQADQTPVSENDVFKGLAS